MLSPDSRLTSACSPPTILWEPFTPHLQDPEHNWFYQIYFTLVYIPHSVSVEVTLGYKMEIFHSGSYLSEPIVNLVIPLSSTLSLSSICSFTWRKMSSELLLRLPWSLSLSSRWMFFYLTQLSIDLLPRLRWKYWRVSILRFHLVFVLVSQIHWYSYHNVILSIVFVSQIYWY